MQPTQIQPIQATATPTATAAMRSSETAQPLPVCQRLMEGKTPLLLNQQSLLLIFRTARFGTSSQMDRQGYQQLTNCSGMIFDAAGVTAAAVNTAACNSKLTAVDSLQDFLLFVKLYGYHIWQVHGFIPSVPKQHAYPTPAV